MSIKQNFIDWIEKRTKRQREEEVVNRDWWHSRGYHKFFEGYSEYYVTKPNGKPKIERIYTGLYYKADMKKSSYTLVKASYLLLYLCLVYLFITGSAAVVTSNFVWYATFPQALFIPVLFYQAIVIVSYVTAKEKMQIHKYKTTSKALIKSSVFGAIYCGLSAVGVLVNMLITKSFSGALLSPCIKFIVCAVIQFAYFMAERNIEYDAIINENKVPDYGFEIQ